MVNNLSVETEQSYVKIILVWPYNNYDAVAEPLIIFLTAYQLVQCMCCTNCGILLHHLCFKMPAIGGGMIMWPLEIDGQF